jgi:hypothetical protein
MRDRDMAVLGREDWETEAGEAIRGEAEKGIVVENWPHEESKSKRNICMKGKRSFLGTPKKRSFQVKDADDRQE